jgi:hypothetical protein
MSAAFASPRDAARALEAWIIEHRERAQRAPAAPPLVAIAALSREPDLHRNRQRAPLRAQRIVRPRGASTSHKDVEFAVDDNRGDEHIFKTFEEAAAFAAGLALTTGVRIEIDVLVHSRDGAVWWSGNDGGEQYDDDPDASVFDRLVMTIKSSGKVP